MPVLRGSVTFSRFRADPQGERAKDVKRWAQRSLLRHAFEPIDKKEDDDRAAGWVEVERNDRTEFTPSRVIFGEYLLASYRVDRLRVPGPVVRAELDAWAEQYEAENAGPPKRSERRNQKAEITFKLRQRAFPVTRTYDVSWNLTTQEVGLWVASAGLVEELMVFMEETFEIRLLPMTPGAIAESLDAPAGVLLPTAALLGGDLAGEVGSRATSDARERSRA